MPQTGVCNQTNCDLETKELYDCHCCSKLICLKHLVEHVETSKHDKQTLINELSTITNTFQLIINEKLRQIEYDNKLIEEAKELLHSQKCSMHQLKTIFEKINLAIQSNDSDVTTNQVESSLDVLESTHMSSICIDSTYDTNNVESAYVQLTPINIVSHKNTMESSKDEQENKVQQIGVYSVCGRCPLIFDGAFGLNRRKHSLNICPEVNSRKIRLYTHFTVTHKLKRNCARRLLEAIKNRRDPKTTKLFHENEDAIDHFYKLECPFNDDTMASFEYDKDNILGVPCPWKSIYFSNLISHLTTYHNLPNLTAKNVYDHYKQMREQNGDD